jgi:peptidoglycan/xylan/chitin deacetylase (PgdA/CDA1 family)
MRGVNEELIRRSLDLLYFSGVYHLMAPLTAGLGVVFMLHRVRAAPDDGAFAPNGALEVTPDFLDGALARLKGLGIDIVDLNEAARRIAARDGRRFAVFTFDDGYADNLDVALPIFEAHDAPFTIYVTTGLIDGTADIWWLLLEEAIARLSRVRITAGAKTLDLAARNAAEKQAAWDAVYWRLRDLSIVDRRAAVAALAAQAGLDEKAMAQSVAATWPQLQKASAHPLVTLGAHTLTHPPLSALPDAAARAEIAESKNRIEAETGRAVQHFAYPFGDRGSAGPRDFALAREIGFATAVTTRRGPLFAEHAEHLHALPRVSLNGNFQAMRYVDLFLSGAPFALFNRARKLDVA